MDSSFKKKIDIRGQYKQNQKFRFVVQVFCVILGAMIGGIAIPTFYQPAKIISSGLSGVAQLVSEAIVGNQSLMTIIYIIMNVILLAVALKLFGWKFIVFTLIGTASYTVAMQYFRIPIGTPDPLLFCLIGGGIAGLGQGIAFRVGGSTGGSDIAAKIINRFFPRIKTGVAVLIINLIVISITVLVKGWQTALYAVIVSVISTITCDMVLDGSKKVRAFYIICDKDQEIAEAILQRFHRGVTVLPAQGKFSGKDKRMLLCLVENTQVREMKEIIKDIDKNAFVFSTAVSETLGDGYFMREASIIKNKIRNATELSKQDLDLQRMKSRPKKLFGKRWKFTKNDD